MKSTDYIVDENNMLMPADSELIAPNQANAQSSLAWTNGDSLADNAKAPEYLINNILETDSHGLLAGSSMAFKSFCVIAMSHSICTGNDFMGNKTYQTGKVVYVCGEGMGALGRRIKALKLTLGGFNDNLIIMDNPLFIDCHNAMKSFKQALDIIKPALVIFDTFSSLTGNTKENDNNEVAACTRLVKETCRSSIGTSSVIVHHFGKDKAAGVRGASSFGSNVDFNFALERAPDSMLTTLSCIKQKDGENFPDITMRADVVELPGLIRQDGEITTSLVLSLTDEVAKDKSKRLTPNQEKGMLSLNRILDNPAKQVPVPTAIRKQYGGFNFDRKIVLYDDWRKELLHQIESDFIYEPGEKTEIQINSAKRAEVKRIKDSLVKLRKVVLEGKYIWPFHYTNSDENGY